MAKSKLTTSQLVKKYEMEIRSGIDKNGRPLSITQRAYRNGFCQVKCRSTSWDELYAQYLGAVNDIQKAYFNGALTRFKRFISAVSFRKGVDNQDYLFNMYSDEFDY